MKVLLSKVRETLRKKHTRKLLMRFVSVFSAIVVFVTTYALILPAITLETNASCGIEEHQHSDECYEVRLICDLEESDGHHHDDSCYEVVTELDCEIPEHQHSAENGCYDADGNLICELAEHVHDDSCYSEVKTLICGLKESDGHHHTDACYEKALVCGKEVHVHSAECYEKDGSDASEDEVSDGQSDEAQEADTDVTAAISEEDAYSDSYIPELESLNMEAVLDQDTDFYYFHAEEGQEAPANSADIMDWKQVETETELASTDLVKMYLSYSIPAGSLNETNQAARYRLPENIHLTDEQIEAINKNENGFYAGLMNSDAADSAWQYLGAEAVEGDRTPDKLLRDDEQEYISAVVRAENVYEEDVYLGQDLIFTFVPYTIEKNQNTYDAEQNLLSAGETVTGWFACDFKLDQIDWEVEEDETADTQTENDADDRVEKTVRKTATFIFAEKNEEENIEEISRSLKLVEKTIADETEEDSQEEAEQEFKSGTLTADGDGYKVRLDYTEEAQIPEDASLSVREITPETDEEAYETCLARAREQVSESAEQRAEVDTQASRFFDIEIIVTEEDGTSHKIEPAAPVSVNIQIEDAPADTSDSESASKDVQNTDPTVLHFSEDGVEQIESASVSGQKDDAASEGGETTEISFEAESFSIYGLVYTVDFHWEVDGRQYEYSLPGGGFASFSKLMEILSVTEKDAQENSQNNPEENLADEDNEDSRIQSALTMENVQVSEETRRFVSDVDTVEFSSPELVWVAKVGEETTVGGLKEANELEVQYSAELTEEEIETINAQTVEAGDWALISMLPFASEETLTVTMKDGEQFVVKVTDAQYDGSKVTDLNGATGALINKTNNNAVLGTAQSSTALKAVTVTVNGDQISTTDGSPELTQWTFTYIGNWNGNDHYQIRCNDGYLHLASGSATISSSPQDLIVVTRQNNGETQIRIANDNHDALNNTSNNTSNGYSTYNNWGYTNNPGEWFTVYKLTYADDPFDLDGKSRTIINNRDGGNNWQALRDEIDGAKDGRGYYVSGNATTYTRTDNVDYSSGNDVVWTFEFVKNDSTGAYYRIKTANGYLFIDPDVTKKSDMPSNQSHAFEHALRLKSAAGDGSSSDGTLIRIVPNGDGTYLLQNRNGVSLWNYGNNQFWLSTLAEENNQSRPSRFRLATWLEPPHVTVHYVDRYGNPLSGVTYNGTNSLVRQNQDGTFSIPYNWTGLTTETSVNLQTQFSKEGYTYANTHLAGKDADGVELKHDGYIIDATLSSSNGSLYFKSDSGETNGNPNNNPPLGNLDYRNLTSFNLADRVYRRPGNNGSVLPYTLTNNKDIYVILDPVPTESSIVGPGGVDPGAVEAPSLEKTMESNDDGTYTLSLKVDAHAKNASDTNKANILFVVDTSSSMRNPTQNNSNRIIDTHDAVLDLGSRLLAYNNSTHPDSVQVSMIAFDGGVYDRLPWTTNRNTFETTVNEYLRYYYMHQGTDWEDALKRALYMCQNPPDDDPTLVVFFTDGEPSQYTSFQGPGENTKTDYGDPLNNNSFSHEAVSDSYPNYYSYFLSREGSKDELRAIVDTGAMLYGIYAYNTTTQSYDGYNGREDGAKMLHNAIRYGYNTTADLTNNLFYEAKNTSDLQGAFDKIYNLITEKVGFTNVAVTDGISAGVTSSTVLNGDVSAFTYTIRDKSKAVVYKVTVAPNGAPEGTEDGKPIFWIGGSGPPVVGEKKEISTTKIVTDSDGRPILDENNKIQTETIDVEVYYYKDANNNEYIMPIAVPDETVTWDLSPFGVLKDGYSYQVEFVVWPIQDAYDLVADLNNGKRPDIEATGTWEAQPLKTDSSGRKYRQGGFAEYPYISRYEDNGVYAAMSNTEQNVEYYKIDNKTVNGEEVTEITGPFEKPVDPPDPMPLTASLSRLEKLWNYERNPALFAQYLYNTDGSSKGFVVDFDIFQGENLTDPYTTESLGWVYDLDANGQHIYLGENASGDYVLEEDEETHTQLRAKGHYVWEPGGTMTNVTYAGHAHQIGTRWVTDFSIATGLMLTEGEMDRLGIKKSLYPSTEYGEGTDRKTYYILEPGHDYTIKEHQTGTIGYEFDFTAPVYHPMLIDGILKNVEITYTYRTDEQGKKVIASAVISKISDNQVGLSGLEIENTLRGYINLNKVVVDEDNQTVESDNTKFEYTIKLESSLDPGPFKGTHIPWYGINGLYYNDGTETYYQVYEDTGGTWMIKNEAGEEYPLTSTGFDPDDAEAQTVTYEVDGQEKQVTLYGNQMTATQDGKTATATLAITQNETLYIANVPKGTKYTITETNQDEYVLVDILKEVKNGSTVEKSEHVTDLSKRTAEGTIVTNRDNHVTYKNKVLTGGLNITKTIQKNGSTDTSATGKFYYAVYDEVYNPNADPAQTPVRTGSINVTANGTATVTEENLKIGTYYVYELTGENGTPVTSGGIFNGGKYYAVTTTGSPVTVTYGGTSMAGIINNYETIPVTATKTWADNNPENLTVYFKLFYESSGGVDVTTGTPLEPLASGVTSVTWPDMPKYDETGSEYTYIVREYVLDEEHGELTEGGHKYTEAAPNGYVNTEVGLSVTNIKLETYEPVTTYSGLKLWVDTVNGGLTRPDRLNVTLMIDKEPYGNPAGDVPALDENGQPYQHAWVTIDEDEWRYTFHNLPVFDEEMKIIRYYAVETPVAGYDDTITNHSDTQYVSMDQYNTFGHTENDADIDLSSDADLAYVAVRIQHEGYLHHIWTQRVPTDEEKIKLIQFVNQDLSSQGLGNPAATVDNTHWVSGLPIDHEFVYSPRDQGAYKIKLTRTGTKRIHLEVNKHEVFSNICYGTLKYDYTAGSTDFKNELQPVSYTVEKNWADGKTPPEGSVIIAELQAKVTRKVEPQPEGQTEPQYETVPVDFASVGVTQKIQVTLNGGAEGGDDTTANPWKYTWSNLPPCDKAGTEITYSVKEISYTIGGHTVNLKDFVPTEDSSSNSGTTTITNKIPAFSFNILKIDGGSAAALIGAKFTIQQIYPTSDVPEPTYVVGGITSPSTPEITGIDGKVSFNNIPLGYYEVEEKELPPGYVFTQDQDGKFYIRVDTDSVKLLEKVITDRKLSFKEVDPDAGGRIKLGNVELTKEGNIFMFTVENTSGAALPYTGGPGTRIFTILGAILIAGAGFMMWKRRRVV